MVVRLFSARHKVQKQPTQAIRAELEREYKETLELLCASRKACQAIESRKVRNRRLKYRPLGIGL